MEFDRAQLSIMEKQKIIRYLQSFLAIPMLMVTIPLAGVNVSPAMNISVMPIQKNTNENSVITTQEEVSRREKANKIDTFFSIHDAPLEGYGMKFVVEAEKNNIDWRLLPSIAMRETTGGKHSCKNSEAPNNSFGWFSCKKGFKSIDESIEFIGLTISGNNPTSKYYNTDMTTEEILKKYNPDYIIPGYSKQVMNIMEMISSVEVG